MVTSARAWAGLLALLLPAMAAAEGARLELSCTRLSRCDGAGACAAAEGAVAFTLAPLGVDAQGAGGYAIGHDGAAQGEGQGVSFAGPFLWTLPGGARHTLVLSSETTALYLRQAAGGAAPEIDFLNCGILP
ncbi:MAG TPA: hypothetical protein DEB47_21835 [Citreicella sp.]|nr:hypothetical protein [Citreicella sp.]